MTPKATDALEAFEQLNKWYGMEVTYRRKVEKVRAALALPATPPAGDAPPGFVLVPRTKLLAWMRTAKYKREPGHICGADNACRSLEQSIEAMLAAAPSPPHENEIEGLDEAIAWFERMTSDADNTYPPKVSDRYKKILKAARRYAAQREDQP